jgi:hypothetical protein
MGLSIATTAPSSMHGAVVPLAYATASGTSSVYFGSIPQTYQDLYVVVYSRDATSGTTTTLFTFLNSDSTSLYSYTYLQGDGASATSGRASNTNPFGVASQIASGATSGIFASNTMHILNYTNTSTYKTILGRSASDANGSGNTRLYAGLYRSTSAITAVTINAASTFTAGSTVALYGVRTVNQ